MIRPASPDEPTPAVPVVAGEDLVQLGHLWWLDWTREQLGDLQDMAERFYYPTFAETDLMNTLKAHVAGPSGQCLGAHLDGRHQWPCAARDNAEAALDAMRRAAPRNGD